MLSFKAESKRTGKLGLRNASELLNRIRSKYSKEGGDPNHNKTFIEESIEFDQNLQSGVKAVKVEPPHQSIEPSGLSPIKERAEPEPKTFCDHLITQTLKEKLEVYKEDLKTMEENGEYLVEQIEVLADKIKGLDDIRVGNQNLKVENRRARERLQGLVDEYHSSKMLLFKSRISQQYKFNSLKRKAWMVFRESPGSQEYVGFVNYWNRHVEQMLADRVMLEKEQESKIPHRENIGPKVRPGREEQEEDEDDIRPKKKKLTEAEKAMLLGDLKSFSRNFKFPS